MNFFITFLIFMIILFLYVHINDQYKKSEDLEIYELDYVSNTHLQEICNVKQPTVFEMRNITPEIFSTIENREPFANYENIDIKVKDVLDYWNPKIVSVDPIILSTSSFHTLMKSDPKAHFLMEDNPELFLDTETKIGYLDAVRELDDFLKPSFTMHTKYDMLMGSDKCVTPLRYHTEYRKFLIVAKGKISVKMTPWKSRKHLHPVIDYDNYEFFSKINPWSIQKKYFNEMDKLKFLDFEVLAGHVLYIPPFWWYSIQLHQDTQVLSIQYQTTMNIISNLPDIFRYYLQFHNTKVKLSRTYNIPIESAL